MPDFHYQEPFPLSKDTTNYRKVEGSEQHVSIVKFDGKDVLKIDPEALTVLANQAMRFDALLIQRQAKGNNEINWIQNAFYAE